VTGIFSVSEVAFQVERSVRAGHLAGYAHEHQPGRSLEGARTLGRGQRHRRDPAFHVGRSALVGTHAVDLAGEGARLRLGSMRRAQLSASSLK
jgi:hypothetical protein